MNVGTKNGETRIDDDMDSDTVTESDLSLRSRSFLHRVNDRVRKILDHSSTDAMQDIDKRSIIWGMFMSSTWEASVFMGKNYSGTLHSIKNTRKDLTLKQMFDTSEKLIVEQSDEIYGVTPIHWEDSPWKHLSLIGGEIKMIIKGRRPTMRHVSRTHRVALDWLFHRINLDPKIHIKHVGTKNQLADMLTKGNFTRDEWNHLLCLFSIIALSVPSIVLKRCRKEHQKMQVKKESQQNRNR